MEVIVKGEKRVININDILAVDENEIKEQLICKICQCVMINPVQFCEIGHVFCSKCITKWLLKNSNSNNSLCCPICRQVYYFKSIFIEQNNFTMNQKYLLSSNNEIKRKINKIKVHCPFYFKNDELSEFDENDNQINNKSCKEIIKFGDILTHMEQCEYRFIKCSSGGIDNNHCKDLRYIDKETHYESCQYIIVKCDLCNSNYLRKDKFDHLNVCPNVSIPCEYCSSDIERSKLSNHYTDCPDYLIECSFKDYGCLDKFKRCNFNQHLAEYNYHYDFNLKKINALSLEIEKLNFYFSKKIVVFEKVSLSDGKKTNNVSISKSLFGQNIIVNISKKDKYSHYDIYLKSNNKIIYEEKKILINSSLFEKYIPGLNPNSYYDFIIILYKNDLSKKDLLEKKFLEYCKILS